jgi:hypothetical protein
MSQKRIIRHESRILSGLNDDILIQQCQSGTVKFNVVADFGDVDVEFYFRTGRGVVGLVGIWG